MTATFLLVEDNSIFYEGKDNDLAQVHAQMAACHTAKTAPAHPPFPLPALYYKSMSACSSDSMSSHLVLSSTSRPIPHKVAALSTLAPALPCKPTPTPSALT